MELFRGGVTHGDYFAVGEVECLSYERMVEIHRHMPVCHFFDCPCDLVAVGGVHGYLRSRLDTGVDFAFVVKEQVAVKCRYVIGVEWYAVLGCHFYIECFSLA